MPGLWGASDADRAAARDLAVELEAYLLAVLPDVRVYVTGFTVIDTCATFEMASPSLAS